MEQELSNRDGTDVKRTITGQFDISNNFESEHLFSQFSSVAQLRPTLCNPLDCKEIQPVHPKGDQSWVFIGRTDVEAQTPILWLSDAKS